MEYLQQVTPEITQSFADIAMSLACLLGTGTILTGTGLITWRRHKQAQEEQPNALAAGRATHNRNLMKIMRSSRENT